jgi:hypothetical protein
LFFCYHFYVFSFLFLRSSPTLKKKEKEKEKGAMAQRKGIPYKFNWDYILTLFTQAEPMVQDKGHPFFPKLEPSQLMG